MRYPLRNRRAPAQNNHMDTALTISGFLVSGLCGCAIGVAGFVLFVLALANSGDGKNSPFINTGKHHPFAPPNPDYPDRFKP
jgi:hypothetical protein